MKIVNVKLKNIKKFTCEQIYEFDEAGHVNTISGRNGSGKSTIFESVLLCQKAYFVKLLSESVNNVGINISELEAEVKYGLKKIVVNKNAYIEINVRFSMDDFTFKIDANRYTATTSANGINEYDVQIRTTAVSMNDGEFQWDVEVNEGQNHGLLNRFWNIQNPSQIIVYLDADKNVYEEDFTYHKISMLSNEDVNPIVQFVLQSKSIYQNMYDIMMNAYVYQRINPQTPKKDLFVTESKDMYHELIPNIEISNFSGKEKKDQFVLISKNEQKYDARNLSSGEKLIWYSLLIMNYVKKIGVLIIDEPENHLHEQLAWKFVIFLREKVLQKTDLNIGQIFLITHSKNLIYNNFTIGSNYVIDNTGNMLVIQKENGEDVLRSCGISYIDDRVLFVEGKTESENLRTLCEMNNVRIRQLSNCSEILRVYDSLLKVKELVYVPKFIFVIDRDTRDDEKLQQLRLRDSTFFDKHFAVLPVHEFENFLLDEESITNAVNSFLKWAEKEPKNKNEVLEIMKKYADESLPDTKKKYLNDSIREKIKNFTSLVKKRDINIENQSEYNNYIDGIFSGGQFDEIKEKIKKEYELMMDKYGVLNWTTDWKKICDGKRVFSQTIGEIAQKIGVSPVNLSKRILDDQMKNETGELYSFWKDVLNKFDD